MQHRFFPTRAGACPDPSDIKTWQVVLLYRGAVLHAASPGQGRTMAKTCYKCRSLINGQLSKNTNTAVALAYSAILERTCATVRTLAPGLLPQCCAGYMSCALLWPLIFLQGRHRAAPESKLQPRRPLRSLHQ